MKTRNTTLYVNVESIHECCKGFQRAKTIAPHGKGAIHGFINTKQGGFKHHHLRKVRDNLLAHSPGLARGIDIAYIHYVTIHEYTASLF